MYSLGIIFYKLIFGYHPFYTEDEYYEYEAKHGEIAIDDIIKKKKK